MTNSKLQICLVDDDQIYQFTARKVLESINPENKILAFFNGEQAIDYLKTMLDKQDELPDVLFLDINMPVMDGWQFLDAYKAILPSLHKPLMIYMVSSSVNEQDIEKSKEYGTVTDYIIKPVQREKFLSLLSAFYD